MTSQEKSPEEPGRTTKLSGTENYTIVVPGMDRFGFENRSTDEVVYHPVPFNYKSIVTDKSASWRVQLKFGAPIAHTIFGLDIYGDVTLGRGKGGSAPPDVDLTEQDALKLGVSRRHAMLRPTPSKLFLLDLGSTNGTFLNAMPVGKGMAKALQDGDAVALGDLGFILEIVGEPA